MSDVPVSVSSNKSRPTTPNNLRQRPSMDPVYEDQKVLDSMFHLNVYNAHPDDMLVKLSLGDIGGGNIEKENPTTKEKDLGVSAPAKGKISTSPSSISASISLPVSAVTEKTVKVADKAPVEGMVKETDTGISLNILENISLPSIPDPTGWFFPWGNTEGKEIPAEQIRKETSVAGSVKGSERSNAVVSDGAVKKPTYARTDLGVNLSDTRKLSDKIEMYRPRCNNAGMHKETACSLIQAFFRATKVRRRFDRKMSKSALGMVCRVKHATNIDMVSSSFDSLNVFQKVRPSTYVAVNIVSAENKPRKGSIQSTTGQLISCNSTEVVLDDVNPEWNADLDLAFTGKCELVLTIMNQKPFANSEFDEVLGQCVVPLWDLPQTLYHRKLFTMELPINSQSRSVFFNKDKKITFDETKNDIRNANGMLSVEIVVPSLLSMCGFFYELNRSWGVTTGGKVWVVLSNDKLVVRDGPYGPKYSNVIHEVPLSSLIGVEDFDYKEMEITCEALRITYAGTFGSVVLELAHANDASRNKLLWSKILKSYVAVKNEGQK